MCLLCYVRRTMEKIKIGTIVNAVALRGEVKVYHFSDYKERFEELDQIIVERKGKGKTYEIEKVRYQKGMVILKLAGVDDRNAAEALKESDILITEEDLRELPEDTFYVRDLIGCKVFDAARCGEEGVNDAAQIGEIKDVLQNSAQDIYVVKTASGKEAMIPAVGDFVDEVNIEEKYVKVKLIPGLIDDEGTEVRD